MSQKEMELSIQEQKELLICYDGGNLQHISDRRAAKILKISLRTLRMLLKNREAIEGNLEINTHSIDSCGICQTKNRHELLLNDDYVKKGLFQCSQQMPNFNLSVNNDFLLDKDIASQDLKDLINYALNNNFKMNDIYSLVEIGLYYHDDLNKSFHFDGFSSDRCEKHIQILSVIFICNILGIDKKRPLVIDNNSHNSQCEGYPTSFNALKTNYYTTSILNWDREIGQRKILLILDNRSVHPTLQLQNIDIKYLPKHFIHPLGQNIIHNAKTHEHYRNTMPPPIVDAANIPTTYTSWNNTALEYVNMLNDTWKGISAALIQNCFRMIGFINTKVEIENNIFNEENNCSLQNRNPYHSTNSSETKKRQLQSGEDQNTPIDLTKKKYSII